VHELGNRHRPWIAQADAEKAAGEILLRLVIGRLEGPGPTWSVVRRARIRVRSDGTRAGSGNHRARIDWEVNYRGGRS
jgi:hypothetical protein